MRSSPGPSALPFASAAFDHGASSYGAALAHSPFVEAQQPPRRDPASLYLELRCPICRTDHAWFAREAWVREPIAREERRKAVASA